MAGRRPFCLHRHRHRLPLHRALRHRIGEICDEADLHPLILTSASGAWFMDSYGAIIDMEMLRNAAETNSAEAGHLITPAFSSTCWSSACCPRRFFVWVNVQHYTFFWKLRANLVVIVPALVIALVAGFSHARVYTATARTHRDWFQTLNPVIPLVTAARFASARRRTAMWSPRPSARMPGSATHRLECASRG